MLVIRFSRVGRHNHAQYRIVVQEKSKAPTKKHIAIVGSYDPHSKQVVLKEEIIKEFLANGAQPSDSVYNLLVSNGVIEGKKRAVKLPEKKVEEEAKENSDNEGENNDAKNDKVEEKTEEIKDKKEEVENDKEKEEKTEDAK